MFQTQTQNQELPVETFMNVSALNPALQNVGSMVNKLLAEFKTKGGTFNAETESLINRINNFEIQKNLAVSEARTSANKQDVLGTDKSMKDVDTIESDEQDTIKKLLAEHTKTRELLTTSLAPTEQETELKRKLNKLRTERQLLPLELRKEGISAPGIAGRKVEDERVRAIQEQNLLQEIGLEQEARKFKTSVLEKQLSFITDDINLQFKIEDRIKQDAKDILDEARTLRKDSLSAMSDILESFEGLAFEDLDAESQAEVLDIAKQFDIKPNLLASAMKNSKQQKIFDKSIELAKLAGKEKEPTQVQFTTAGYAQRIEQAQNIFSNIEGSILEKGATWIAIQRKSPNIVKSSLMKQYEQAERNFINSVLRRESGAAIAESEFENARQQYFVQAGDDKSTILQKQLNRQLILENFKRESGGAFQSTSLTKTPGNKMAPGSIIKSKGVLYMVGSDGETLTAIGSAK